VPHPSSARVGYYEPFHPPVIPSERSESRDLRLHFGALKGHERGTHPAGGSRCRNRPPIFREINHAAKPRRNIAPLARSHPKQSKSGVIPSEALFSGAEGPASAFCLVTGHGFKTCPERSGSVPPPHFSRNQVRGEAALKPRLRPRRLPHRTH
jgi:hypothetical protein